MPFPYAMRFSASNHTATAAANAAYNDLSQLSVVTVLRYSNADSGCLWSKGNSNAALFKSQFVLFGDSTSDFRVSRAGQVSGWRGAGLSLANEWQVVCDTLNRSTGVVTRHIGPLGGTMATVTVTDTNAGSGTVDSDASFAFALGANSVNNGALIMEVGAVYLLNSVLSLSQFQTFTGSWSSGALVSGWEATASGGTVPNVVSGLPSLALSGVTIVAGPDASAGGSSGAVQRLRRDL